MATKKRIAIGIGEYTKSDGSKGTNWLTVGSLVTKDDGGQFIELIPFINFTALPRKDGKLMCGVFADEKNQQQGQAKAAGAPASPPLSDDSIPF